MKRWIFWLLLLMGAGVGWWFWEQRAGEGEWREYAEAARKRGVKLTENQEAGGDGKKAVATVQSFSGKNMDGKPGEPDPTLPSGRPGTEKDKGTTLTPFGKQGTEADPKTQEQLAGKLAEGESLSALIPSAAKGDAKATRRYKELTDAAAASAAEAVNQENIPLGSRFLIRRYFEAIRPK